jgi:cysteine desulfuration protein SufE
MDTLASRLDSLVEELRFVGDWTDRYRLLVEWGESLEPLPAEERVSGTEVAGCSSPLWLSVRWVDGALQVRGASPGILPKALLSLIYRLFGGVSDTTGSVAQIMDALELPRNLSPTRTLVMERLLERALTCPRPPHD